MLSHSNLATNLVQCQPGPVFNLNRYVPGGPQETFIAILPFFHTYGLFACVHQALFVGAHVRCFQQFEPVVLLKGIREHKVIFESINPGRKQKKRKEKVNYCLNLNLIPAYCLALGDTFNQSHCQLVRVWEVRVRVLSRGGWG